MLQAAAHAQPASWRSAYFALLIYTEVVLHKTQALRRDKTIFEPFIGYSMQQDSDRNFSLGLRSNINSWYQVFGVEKRGLVSF